MAARRLFGAVSPLRCAGVAPVHPLRRRLATADPHARVKGMSVNLPKDPRHSARAAAVAAAADGADDRDDAPTQFQFSALLPRSVPPVVSKVPAVDVPIDFGTEGGTGDDVDLVLDADTTAAAGAGAGADARADALVVDTLAPPRGAYPHLRRAGPFLFVSGTSARRPDGSIEGADVDASGATHLDIRAQTRAVITKVQAIVRAAGAELGDLVEWTTYLVDMNDYAGYNEVYAEFFSRDSGPARTTVAVHQLPHPHLRIEVRAVAWLTR